MANVVQYSTFLKLMGHTMKEEESIVSDLTLLQKNFLGLMQAGQDLMKNMAQLNSPTRQMFSATLSEASNPENPLVELQAGLMKKQMDLWQSMLKNNAENSDEFEAQQEPGDRRFRSSEWSESPIFYYIQQIYLLNSQYVKEAAELLPAENDQERKKLRFMARQLTEALSPTNFPSTNPEVIKEAIDTEGRSITEGIKNLIEDLGKGRISTTDETAYEVGVNVATTPGCVIYENEMMQLIQYTPLTKKVAKRPLLFVPPCINKYYIMDLQPENSLVRFAIEQGHTVFLISWRNPKEEQSHVGWDDYIEQGPLCAIRIIQEVCKVKEMNALGFCVGGTLLSTALAVLAARGEHPVKSLTLMTTLLDFSDAGELGLFVDETSTADRESKIGQGGLLSGRELSSTFSSLRANDLIWNYVVSNYLKGKKPTAFDLLYWNADSTNLPGPFAVWYTRNMYLENNLCVSDKLTVCGNSVDLGKINCPAYLVAAREDHIVPWQTSYLGTKLLGGAVRFVLGASGHIAGAINPASKNKRNYWTNNRLVKDPEKWLEKAEEYPGSWWLDWADWLAEHKDGEVEARKPGTQKYKVIEPAPGRYVKEKI